MHPLLILVLVFDLLIAVSSVLNLVNMMRVNLMVEERRAEALTVQRVRVQKAAAGKGGILASWYGVYACPAKDGTGEFTSSNPYGSEAAVIHSGTRRRRRWAAMSHCSSTPEDLRGTTVVEAGTAASLP